MVSPAVVFKSIPPSATISIYSLSFFPNFWEPESDSLSSAGFESSWMANELDDGGRSSKTCYYGAGAYAAATFGEGWASVFLYLFKTCDMISDSYDVFSSGGETCARDGYNAFSSAIPLVLTRASFLMMGDLDSFISWVWTNSLSP